MESLSFNYKINKFREMIHINIIINDSCILDFLLQDDNKKDFYNFVKSFVEEKNDCEFIKYLDVNSYIRLWKDDFFYIYTPFLTNIFKLNINLYENFSKILKELEEINF